MMRIGWYLLAFLLGIMTGDVFAFFFPAAFCRVYGAVVAWLHAAVTGMAT